MNESRPHLFWKSACKLHLNDFSRQFIFSRYVGLFRWPIALAPIKPIQQTSSLRSNPSTKSFFEENHKHKIRIPYIFLWPPFCRSHVAYSHFIFSNAGANSQQLIGEKIGLVCSFFAIEFACLTAGLQLVPLWNTPIYNTILEAFWHAIEK